MQRVSFDVDWLDPSRIAGPELSATWASLRIHVGDTCVTRVEDRRAKTVRDSVYVPLYPLAEWLAANWWFLGFEVKNQLRENDQGFRRRHALITSREGYAYPDLQIVSSGSNVHLAWRAGGDQWSDIAYLVDGEGCVDAEGFREDCTTFIDQVTRRLESLGIEGTYLQEEWAAVQQASDEEARFCRTAGGLGWDPYALAEEQRSWLLALSCQSDDLLAEATAVLDPANPEHGWSAIEQAIGDLRNTNGCAFDRVRGLRHSVCPAEEAEETTPWQIGYNWARRLRSGLRDEEAMVPGMEGLADLLGEERKALEEAVTPAPFVDDVPMLDGIVANTDDGLTAFGLRSIGGPGRRFHLCRAVAEILAGRGDMLVTKAASARQQRNRAFAAEFLVPSGVLRNRIKRSVVDSDDIDELAAEFSVSSFVVKHQIENHKISQIASSIHHGPGAVQ